MFNHHLCVDTTALTVECVGDRARQLTGDGDGANYVNWLVAALSILHPE